jgi:ketosteroid isomerase-like protein
MMAICAAAIALGGTLMAAESETEIAKQLVALERKALEGWIKGDPDPDLAISDPAITLFHPPFDKRLDGLPAVKEFYEKYRGMAVFDSYEIVDPKVQASGDTAVLTFLFECRNGDTTHRYYSTLVWHRTKDGWRVIHAHWSKAKTT